MLKIHSFRKAVTTAGTQERLTTADITAKYVRIQPEDDNTGIVFIGDSEVSSVNGIELVVSANNAAVQTVPYVEFSAIENHDVSLRDIWVDVATGADGVQVVYMTAV